MKKTSITDKVEMISGYGHQGIVVRLNIFDELEITSQLKNLEFIKEEIAVALEDKPELLAPFDSVTHMISTFLRRLTTFDEVGTSSLFDDDADIHVQHVGQADINEC